MSNSAWWVRDAVFYHVYPLGLCGAPRRNDFTAPVQPRLNQLHSWIGHWRDLGVNALYLGPLFESSAHGYDTADYFHVDRRLGSNADLAELARALHANGIRLILDGVFHHVGRDFWAFRDLLEHGQQSRYRDWFSGVNFSQRSPYGDPFAYDTWQGAFDLVKLNLHNHEVREHLFSAVASWVRDFDIDGLRLDVAEVIDLGFLRELATFSRSLRRDFWLLGEVIHGDYRHWANSSTLDSVTNYECYKGLYSSHNDRNYFEIAYSLQREFGPDGIYRDLPLYNFADNHDVNRVASTLREPAHLYPLYLLLFTIPGVPSIYAGSEWGFEGVKVHGDDSPLRPALSFPESARTAPHPDLVRAIARFATIRSKVRALRRGGYRQLFVAHQQMAFLRFTDTEPAVVAVNADSKPVSLSIEGLPENFGSYVDLLEPGRTFTAQDGRIQLSDIPACWGRILIPIASKSNG